MSDRFGICICLFVHLLSNVHFAFYRAAEDSVDPTYGTKLLRYNKDKAMHEMVNVTTKLINIRLFVLLLSRIASRCRAQVLGMRVQFH